jgi:hypothetical protein
MGETNMIPAERNLRDCQRQLDMDGCEVGVSRQALEETLSEIERIRSENGQLIEAAAQRSSCWRDQQEIMRINNQLLTEKHSLETALREARGALESLSLAARQEGEHFDPGFEDDECPICAAIHKSACAIAAIDAALAGQPIEERIPKMLDAETKKKLVDRFLAWPLPQSVCSDTCVSDSNYQFPRSGTNLLNVDEAAAMIEYLFSDAALAEKATGTSLFDSLHIESMTREWFSGPKPSIDGYLRVLRMRLDRASPPKDAEHE